MHSSVLTILLAATTTLAVDISGAPACAQKCLRDNQGSSTCDPDAVAYTCFCADTAFYSKIQTCVLAGCSLTDAVATLTWYGKVCPS